jgi:hypothetical protein
MISQIEQTLQRISDAAFHQFCDTFMYQSQNPNSFSPNGRVIGKDKSRKGFPDTYFIDSQGRLVFCEYTTKDKKDDPKQFLEKLKRSIADCFDEQKTGRSIQEVSRVILCYNSNLNLTEDRTLRALARDFNDKCILDLYGIGLLAQETLRDRVLMNLLGIRQDTGQLLSAQEFINVYQRSSLSTPLDNPFIGRDKELAAGIDALKQGSHIILSGGSGVGKTKLALEIGKRASETQKNLTFLCICNANVSIWGDLMNMIRPSSEYLIFVDDANKMTQHFDHLIEFLKRTQGRRVKIIATVRNFAFEAVQSKIDESFRVIDIPQLSGDLLEAILKAAGYDLHFAAVERIQDLSKGNPRLAMMAAKVCFKSGSLLALENGESLYESYFGSVLSDAGLLSDIDALKTLAILHFFGSVRFDYYADSMRAFSVILLEPSIFKEKCYLLNELEVVDIYNDSVAKVSDQIFGTYLFYKAVFDREFLPFSQLVSAFQPYGHHIKETVLPIIQIYSYKNILGKASVNVKNRWEDVVSTEGLAIQFVYLDIFWFLIPSETLTFFENYISDQLGDEREPWDKNISYGKIDDNLSREFSNNKTVNILCRFCNLAEDRFVESLELLTKYLTKLPQRYRVVEYAMLEAFKIDWDTQRYGYAVQRTVIEFFETFARERDDEMFRKLGIKVLSTYLAIDYEDMSSDGSGFIRNTFSVQIGREVAELRAKCWTYLIGMATDMRLLVLPLFSNLPFRAYSNEDLHNEMFRYDKPFILQLADKVFRFHELEDCIVYHNLYARFSSFRKIFGKAKLRNKKFHLCLLLSNQYTYQRRKGFSERSDEFFLRKTKVFIEKFDENDFLTLFESLSEIQIVVSKLDIHWSYSRNLTLLLLHARSVCLNYFHMLTLFVNKFSGSFGVNWPSFFYHFFQTYPSDTDKIFESVTLLHVKNKICFFYFFNSQDLSHSRLRYYYKQMLGLLSEPVQVVQIDQWDWLQKFYPVISQDEILKDICEVFVKHIEANLSQLSFGDTFLRNCLDSGFFSLDVLEKLYHYQRRHDPHFDDDLSLLMALFEMDAGIFARVVSEINDFGELRLTIQVGKEYSQLWSKSRFSEALGDFFKDLVARGMRSWNVEEVCWLFPEQFAPGSQVDHFFRDILSQNFKNRELVALIFVVCVQRYPVYKIELLKLFLACNHNIDDFRYLQLIRRQHSYFNNNLQLLDDDIEELGKFLMIIQDMPGRLKYLKHTKYINEEIDALNDRKREVEAEIFSERRRH